MKRWDAAGRKGIAVLKPPQPPVVSSNVAFAPDGKMPAAASEDSTVKLWDAVKALYQKPDK